MDELDIRLWGRSWRTDEMCRHDDLPGRLEMWEGKLSLDEKQRFALLGALLEHVGTAYAVRLGPLQAWVDAVEQRLEDLAWDQIPTVGAEEFWRPAAERLSFRRQLELKADMQQLYRRLRRRRLQRR